MGKSCSLVSHIKNSKGEVVESALFNDLVHHLPTRSVAKEYYAVGTNKEFLDRVGDKAKFDENGEITFNSLMKLTKMDIKKETLLATLNKDIGSGRMSYNAAVSRLTDFNRNSQFKDDYMATIKSDGGKYELSVVPRTATEEASLEREIQNRSLRERLMYRLEKAGVGVEFFEKEDTENGRYSTENIDRASNGLYNLIRVAQGEQLTETLAEEAGHFAVAALGKSPLVERLEKLLDEETQKKIYGEEYENKNLGKNSRRETAGYLVGKAFRNNVDQKSAWGNLAYKIANIAKKIFYTFKKNDVMKAKIEAEEIARKIARDFMSDNTQGSIDNALEIRETLYSNDLSINTDAFKKTLANLSNLVSELRAVQNNDLTKKVKAITGLVEGGGRMDVLRGKATVWAEDQALQGIAEGLFRILDMIGPGKEINNLLDSVDFLNDAEFYGHMADNGRKLQQVTSFLKSSLSLQKMLSEYLEELPKSSTLTGNVTTVPILANDGSYRYVDLEQISRDLAAVTSRLETSLYKKQKAFFLKFCETTLGSKYVLQTAKVLWNIHGRHTDKNGKKPFLFKREEGKWTVSDALNFLDNDITWFERFLASMANNSDLIGQIADKACKMANKKADDNTNRVWDDLRLLKDRFDKVDKPRGFTTASLFEKYENSNELTGNLISAFRWGDYERDWQEFKKEKLEEFKATTDLDDLSEFEKAAKWDNFFRPLSKQWHKDHSTFDTERGRYKPNDRYINEDFKDLMDYHPGLYAWYTDFMNLKRELDSRLPDGSTLDVRAPQFKGSYTNIVRNQSYGGVKSIRKGTGLWLRDQFCESSEDTDYGSDNTYNSEEEELFENKLAHDKETIHRVPLFGINKLNNMTELSTDIFHSTLAYASMAHAYSAMDHIVATMEVGKDVLSRRRVGGYLEEDRKAQKKGKYSKAYNRYVKYIDKQVYGLNSTKHMFFGKIVWEKVVNLCTSFASKLFLGGNLHGGIVNTITGFNEILKEAMAGEHFTIKDLYDAHKAYYGSIASEWLQYGKETRDDRLNLFIRHFNIRQSNRKDFRDWYTTNPKARRIYNMFSESIFLPYSSGDHYMQSMAYLAVAKKTKLYTATGSEVSLWDAYQKSPNYHTNENGKIIGKKGNKLVLAGDFYKIKDGDYLYELIESIKDKMKANQKDPFHPIAYTDEEQDYIKEHNINEADTDNALFQLEDQQKELKWGDADESAFMDKCREINNRMHGIYNLQDKTAFQQEWYGNAVLAMRGYALGLFERRFGTSKESIALGHDTEGSLNSFSKFFAYNLTAQWGNPDLNALGKFNSSMVGILKTVLHTILPWTHLTTNAMLDAGFSKNQLANVRRNSADIYMMLLLALIRGATSLGDPDDDDYIPYDPDFDRYKGIIYYFANRLFREQAAYNIIGTWDEMAMITDYCPIGLAALGDFVKLAGEALGAQWGDPEDSDHFYQINKEGLYEKGDSKALRHFWKRFPYLRSYDIWANPYEATKSYNYGQNMRSR